MFWALRNDFVFTPVEWCTYCNQFFLSSWWVQPRGNRAHGSVIAKKPLMLWFTGFETNLLLNHDYQFYWAACNVFPLFGPSTCLCRSVVKLVHYGLPWRWPSHVCLFVQQPWWGVAWFWQHLGLLEVIMARGKWGVWFHVSKWLRPCSPCWQDVLWVGKKSSVDGLVEAH